MRVYDINWCLEPVDIMNIIDIMPAEQVADILNVPLHKYRYMSDKEIYDKICSQKSSIFKKVKQYSKLPEELTIPDKQLKESVAMYLLDKYGHFVTDFKIGS